MKRKVILTVANEEQKQIAKEYIKKQNNSLFNKYTFYILISANGTGTALLDVVRWKEKNNVKEPILVINSGGKSTRTPLFSKRGKIMIPLPSTNNKNKMILDELLELYSKIENKIKIPGVLIMTADSICENVNITEDITESCAISIMADKKYGPDHGVFTKEGNYVKGFLHKKSLDILEKENAIINNNIMIDTGIYFIKEKHLDLLYNNYKKDYQNDLFLDFYAQMVQYIIDKDKMLLLLLKDATFYHLGNYKNYFDYLQNNNIKFIDSIYPPKYNDKKVFFYHSKISENATIEDNVAIFNCDINEGTIKENTIVYKDKDEIIYDKF